MQYKIIQNTANDNFSIYRQTSNGMKKFMEAHNREQAEELLSNYKDQVANNNILSANYIRW